MSAREAGLYARRASTYEELSVNEDLQDEGLRERLSRQGEEALGRIAEELAGNPVVTGALSRVLEAREKAMQAQEAAMGALGVPSAADIERQTVVPQGYQPPSNPRDYLSPGAPQHPQSPFSARALGGPSGPRTQDHRGPGHRRPVPSRRRHSTAGSSRSAAIWRRYGVRSRPARSRRRGRRSG